MLVIGFALVSVLSCDEQSTPTNSDSDDTTAPARITDLTIMTVIDSTITLTWTEPGDDGTAGAAIEYELRYSLLPLTEANWEDANRVTDEPPPGAPGTDAVYELMVGQHSIGRPCYVGIRTADDVPNWSPLSNTVCAWPDLSPPPPTTLIREATDPDQVTLLWLPPTSGFEEMPHQYDLRYASNPISDSTWSSAVQLEGLPAPHSIYEGYHRYTLDPPLSTGTYCFAVRSADIHGNWSVLSNTLAVEVRAASATLHVYPDRHGTYPTIQDAVYSAVAGDVIQLADGIYGGSGNETVSYLGKALLVASESDDPSLCIIDCGSTMGGVFFGYGETQAAELRGVTIQDVCLDLYGAWGGITCCHTSPTLRNLIVKECRSLQGTGCSGLYCDEGSAPVVIDCTFMENTGYGAWIYVTAQFVRCTFADNERGGVYCGLSPGPLLDRCISAFNAGPAIFCDYSSYSGEYGAAQLICCDLYGNDGGDWVKCIEEQLGLEGNISRDPLFTDLSNGDLTLAPESPCAPDSSACGQIGAWPVR